MPTVNVPTKSQYNPTDAIEIEPNWNEQQTPHIHDAHKATMDCICDPCKFKERCKKYKLACSDYKHWVNSGNVRKSKPRIPTTEGFIKLMEA